MNKSIVAVLSSITLLLFVAGGVFANQQVERIPTNIPQNNENAAEQGMQRACEAIESSINTRNENVMMMSGIILEKFDNISARVQEFYVENRVPDGHEVDNYEELLENIEEERQSVELALEAAEASADEFECDLTNPKDAVLSFNDDMRDVIDSLQEYRLAIKDLIVAVSSAPAENGE